jgi:LuxR family transcriptional regulator, maltose regulon positive regulatory protein
MNSQKSSGAKVRLAKLTRPTTKAAYSRVRLFEEFDTPDSAPVVWLSGPPGCGKTTLVGDYTTQRGLDSLWYQVDRGDTDIASFFFYLNQAAAGHLGGAAALPQFADAYLGNIEAFARNYFRELYGRMASPCVVFDNCQDVTATDPLYGVLRVAVDELPHGGRLFIMSRLSPPAGFARLRARGRLRTLGWNELRLTVEEAAGIATARGLALDAVAVERLHARTQGWAAGFILLLQSQDSAAPTVRVGANGTPSVIFDYLAEEVLQRFKPVVRESLLRLAYLPQITEPMGDALGIPIESKNQLRTLAGNGFLVTIAPGDPHPIYQLHPLLREFLEARAEQTGTAEEIDSRKRLAARVLAEHEHFEAAAALHIRLRDWPALAALILGQGDLMLKQGRAQTLESWIHALPEEISSQNPWFLYWMAGARFPYAPRDARELFGRAFRLFSTANPVSTAAVLAAINGALEAIVHDADDFTLLDPWIEAGAKWTAGNPDWPTPDLEARLTCNMFFALVLRQPWHADVPLWRERTQRLSQTHDDPNVRLSVNAVLITLSAWNGQFAGAERLIELMQSVVTMPEVTPVSATKFAQAQATNFMLAGDHRRCIAAARAGLDIVNQSGVRLWNDTFLINGLLSALAEGDLDDAAEWLKSIEARPPGLRRFDLFLQAYATAWYAMLRGDLFLAHQHLKTAVRAATELGPPFFQVFAGLALAQVLQRSGHAEAADRELARMLEITGRLKNRLLDFMAFVCRAALALGRKRSDEALEALRAAFAIGRERGLMHYLWWEPRQAAELCRLAFAAGVEPDYLRHLIQYRQLLPTPPPYLVAGWPWRWQIRAFGAFRVESAAADLAKGTKRAVRPVELLSALVAFGGEHVKIERLADALWPHVDSDYAHRSFNTTLHRLRAWLGADSAVLVHGGEVSLDRRAVWLDTWAFEQAVGAVQALAAAPDLATHRQELGNGFEQALALYRGPLLAAEAETAWAVAPREHYRNMLLRLVTSAATAAEKAGWPEEVAEFCRRGLDAEPLSEQLCRRLMVALKQTGRNAEAIEVFHRYRTMLRAEQKAEPSAATQDVYRTLVPG